MNVVMLGPFAFKPKSTVSVRAFFIGRALVRQNHRVTILMPPYDNPADSGRAWEEDGVRLENLPLKRNDAWHQLTVPLRMAWWTARLRPDVVHLFKPIGYGGMAGIYLRRFSRLALVLDADDWEGKGGWNDVNPYPALWKRLIDWQERWLTHHADAVTVASRTLEMRARDLLDPSRVIYLPNGPDSRLRHMAEPGLEQRAEIRQRLAVGEAPLALYLGNIPHGNDLDLALAALTRLREQLPEARLAIAGVGEGLPALQQLAMELGVADQVVFPGWIPPEEAALFWAAADVAVNPYRDTLINRAKCAGKNVLAMAMGKAVVTSRLGENLAYIEDGRSGLLTEPGDVDDLARALYTVLSDRDLAAELGRNARQRIWSEFDWDLRIDEVLRAYDLAMRARKAGRDVHPIVGQ